MSSMKRVTSAVKPVGPPNPVKTPMGQNDESCQIIFGHNVPSHTVLMQFARAADRLIFTPDEADDVATKLHFYAEAARGKKPA